MDKKEAAGLIVALLILILDMALYYFRPLGSDFYIIADIAVVIYALAAAIFGFYTALAKGISKMHRKALQLIAFGALSWMAGEALWAYQEILLKMPNPFPSVADAFWLIGYMLVLYGIYQIFQIAKTQDTGVGSIIFLLVFMIGSLISVVYWVYPSLVDTKLTAFGKAATFTYLFLDLAIVFWIIALLYLFHRSRVIQSWIWVLISMVFLTFADLLYMGLAESFVSGSFIGMLWDAHYVMLAFGFFYYKQNIKTLTQAAAKEL